MKFRSYPWLTIYSSDEFSYHDLYFLPSVHCSLNQYDFKPEGGFEQSSKGGHFCVMFCWLIFGFTLDFRWGDDAEDDE